MAFFIFPVKLRGFIPRTFSSITPPKFSALFTITGPS